MPYWRPAINRKNKCPERGRWILEKALIYAAPSPGKDRALGRRRDGTALHVLVAAAPDGRQQANQGNYEVISDRGKREAAIVGRLRHPADHVAGWRFASWHRARKSSLELNWPYLTRGDVAGILLSIVILAGLLFVGRIYHELFRKTNFGLGPEWDCRSPDNSNGNPVCIKRPMKPDKSN
jgi:hypothetical protein